jgi:hypothetical protein
MKVKIALFAIVLAALFIAVPVQARMTEPLLPFKADVLAIAGPPPSGPPPWYMDVYGSGVASHMGKVSVYQHHLVAPTADPNVLVFHDGVWIWTAANGDILQGTYSGQLVFNPTGGYFEIHGYFYVDGGTGRFQHATGEGPASGTQGLDGTAELFLDGTIQYFRNP